MEGDLIKHPHGGRFAKPTYRVGFNLYDVFTKPTRQKVVLQNFLLRDGFAIKDGFIKPVFKGWFHFIG